MEHEQHFHPFSSIVHRHSPQQQHHKSPTVRQTTTTVLTKTETLTSPEGSINEENSDTIHELPIIANNRNGIKLATTSSSNIPVGIAVARQRTSTTTTTVIPNGDRSVVNDSGISVSNGTNNELSAAQNLVKIASQTTNPTESISNPTINSVSEKPSRVSATNGDNIFGSLQVPHPYYSAWPPFPYMPSPSNATAVATDNLALHSAAAAASAAAASTLAAQAGFPPLGYQIAKDPLTGQICFVPSAFNVAAHQPPHMLWPPSAIAATLHQLSSPSIVAGSPSMHTLPPSYPMGIHTNQHQSYLEQFQRETNLFSAMARNYTDASLLSAMNLPATNVATVPEEQSSAPIESKQEKSNYTPPIYEDSDKKVKMDHCTKEALGSHPALKLSNLANDTKDNDEPDHKSIVVKNNPYIEDNPILQEYRKFRIDETCQTDKKSDIKTKTELTNLQTKQETDHTSNGNHSNSRKDEPIHDGNRGPECEHSNLSLNGKEGPCKNNSPLLKPGKPLDNDGSITSADASEVVEHLSSKSSHELTQEYSGRSGLDLLAEGVERLESRKESSNDSSHANSRLSSPDFHDYRSYGSLTSPLGMLYDAAILKADEEGQTTPTKDRRYDGLSLEDERTSYSGRSRSLDGQTHRRTSRRNSLCIPVEFQRGYRSPKAERDVRAYIASRSKRCFGYAGVSESINDKLNNEKKGFNGANNCGNLDSKERFDGLQVHGSPKSSTNNACWENEMRSNLANIQKKYKEKYKELYRLDHQMKRIESRNKRRPRTGKGEGAENKTSLSLSKSPIPSPKKQSRMEGHSTKPMNQAPLPPSKSAPLPLHPDILDAQLKEIKNLKGPEPEPSIVKDNINGYSKTNDQLKTYSQLIKEQPGKEVKNISDTKQKRIGRIVPIPNLPRLSTMKETIPVTASSNATDLSVITSKFKVAKPNPFENLLKLSSKPQGVKSKAEDDFSSIKNCHEASEVEKTYIRNKKEAEADPLEENVIFPIVHPISVRDVVDANEDIVHNSITANKSNCRLHFRKKMVETFILKKPKESLDTKEEKTESIIQSASSEPTMTFKDLNNSPREAARKNQGGYEPNNARKGETNVSVIPSNKSGSTSINSNSNPAKTKSKIKLKLKSSDNSGNGEPGKSPGENKSKMTSKVENSVRCVKTEDEDMNILNNSEKFGLSDDKGHLVRLKKSKKNKSKKSKKDKRENKSDKSKRKRMKGRIEKKKQSHAESSDTDSSTHENGIRSSSPSTTDASSCVIKESDLDEGTPVLVKIDGHFHPGKILAISPPDIYGIVVDRERGNRPHIFSREEVLKEAIFEVKPGTYCDLPIGTRVCAYWSEKYHHLYPGTVSEGNDDGNSKSRNKPSNDKNYINVELDDGDERAIHIKNIRFLPPNYPMVSCDNDPLANVSRRRRRQSIENFTRGDSFSQRGSIEDVAVEERIAVAKRARYEMEKTDKSPTKSSPSKSNESKNGTGRLKFTFKTTSSQSTSSNKKKESMSSSVTKPSQSTQPSFQQKQQSVSKPIVVHASRSKLTGKHVQAIRPNSSSKKVIEVSKYFSFHISNIK